RLDAIVVDILEVAGRERCRDDERRRHVDRQFRQDLSDGGHRTGLQNGSVNSSSMRVSATSTGMPIATAPGSTSMSSPSIRTASSNSTSATTNGGCLPGTFGWWWTT